MYKETFRILYVTDCHHLVFVYYSVYSLNCAITVETVNIPYTKSQWYKHWSVWVLLLNGSNFCLSSSHHTLLSGRIYMHNIWYIYTHSKQIKAVCKHENLSGVSSVELYSSIYTTCTLTFAWHKVIYSPWNVKHNTTAALSVKEHILNLGVHTA